MRPSGALSWVWMAAVGDRLDVHPLELPLAAIALEAIGVRSEPDTLAPRGPVLSVQVTTARSESSFTNRCPVNPGLTYAAIPGIILMNVLPTLCIRA